MFINGFFGFDLLSLAGTTPLGRSMKQATEAQIANLETFVEMFNYFSNLAVSRYVWTGLPDSVDERFLNMTLYLFGTAAFFFDETLGYLAMPCTPQGQFNLYYNPVRVKAYSFNYTKTVSDFVYMRNTPTGSATAFSVYTLCRRMSDILRTIDVATAKTKHPYVFLCDEKDVLTYKNMIKKVQDNEIMILGSKKFDLAKNNLEIFQTPTNVDFTKLWENYRSVESLLLTRLGIESVGMEKRERLVTDEVSSNNMLTELSIDVNMESLSKACDEINAKYGLNVSVNYKQMVSIERGDEENGEVYDGVAVTGSGGLSAV